VTIVAAPCSRHSFAMPLPKIQLATISVKSGGLDIVQSAPSSNKSKFQKRSLIGAFHNFKKMIETVRAKLRDKLLLDIPLLQITEHLRLLHGRKQLHPAAATREPRRQHYGLQRLCERPHSTCRRDEPQKKLDHGGRDCS
jgi:hypothetical protein